MDEEKFLETIQKFADKLPKFPDGRIDYSNSAEAPVVTVFVKFGEEILLLKRSNKVSTYQGKWNTVAGYCDEVKPLKDKVFEELGEEIGVSEEMVDKIHYGKPFKFEDKEIGRTWLVHPVIVELKEKPMIKLDFEHTEFVWIKPEEMEKFETVSNLNKSWKAVL